MLKNERVRVEMAKAGINQSKLSEILERTRRPSQGF